MQNEDMDTERALRSFLPIRLRGVIKKKILQKLTSVSSRKPSSGARRATGFIQVALPFGIAAMFVVTSSSHYLMTSGCNSVGASRRLAVANCVTQRVDGVGAGLLFSQERVVSNEVADMSGHTNGFDVAGRSRGTALRNAACRED